MISKSNNAATTKVIDQLGFESIESTLRNTNHKLYDEETGGGLWVGNEVCQIGRKKTRSTCRFEPWCNCKSGSQFLLSIGFLGDLISKERSAEMLTLEDPKLSHKFVNTLNIIAPDTDYLPKIGLVEKLSFK